LLQTYSAALKESYSALEKINLVWLRTILVLFSVVLLADMSINIPVAFFGIKVPDIYYAVLLAEACAVFAIGYLSLRQPEILAGVSLTAADTPKSKPEKYVTSPLDDQLGRELADKLDLEMEQRQLFLKNDLSLTELADIMGLSTRHLSQVINQHRHRNFYDYVNSYRAHHAANFLVSHGKTNLTRLAFESGFNNRVSFSKAFRSHTGQTPTEFISRQAEASAER
jgi:AraC-like DNA-binding protein